MDGKSLGYLGVFVAFIVLSVADLCEGNQRTADKASYGNVFHWRRGDDVDENIVWFFIAHLVQIVSLCFNFLHCLPSFVFQTVSHY